MKDITKAAPQTLLNRELSWLAFNYRVLQEAQDPSVPLLERIKFIAIFSSNLDEYFKVRVATLKRLIKLKEKTRSRLSEDPAAELEQIMAEVQRQQAEFGETFRNSILPELQKNNIHLLTENELSEEQQQVARNFFREQLRQQLRPVLLDHSLNHLFLKDQTVYLTFRLSAPRQPHRQEVAYAILEVPTKALGTRFLKLPTQTPHRYVMFIDDVIRLCVSELFPDYAEIETHAIKISRDAELDIEEEVSGNLMARIRQSLKKREKGLPSRLLFPPDMPQDLLHAVMKKTGIPEEDLVPGSKYHNFRDFFMFPDFNLPELKYVPQPTLPHPELEQEPDLFAAIRKKDYLLHYPYQKFDYVLRFFHDAANDPAVTAISATLYRVADKSEIAKALVKAAKNGKYVTVVVELKARFDEASNIYWASKLEKAGANVIYGVPDYKVHSKLGLVSRIEHDVPVNYAYLSTGNYNEDTSRIYADHALFTSDTRLTQDVESVFNFFIDRQPAKQFRHLLVAPFSMRKKFEALINQEMRNAQAGKPAYMILKMNALQDARMIQKLYEASQAGVRIELIVRGICCLIPGVQDLSENITVRSIVDRYLEHARVYIFANGGQEKMYIASADWMTRNLNRRVEVAFPVYDSNLFAELRHLIDLQRADNLKARDIRNVYLRQPSRTDVRAQYATYNFLKYLPPRQA